MDINGINVLFIGGASSIDKHYRVPGIEWWPQELITTRDIDKALTAQNVDVVVSHESPYVPKLSNKGAEDDMAARGPEFAEAVNVSRQQRELLRKILEQKQPRFWYHGHHHTRTTSILDGCQFECLGCDGDAVSNRVLVIDTLDWY